MEGPSRLDRGGRIARERPLHFRFDGRDLQGFEGDTLASALLGAGISLIGRSLKFHRPRGILTAGIEEPNALVTLASASDSEPSVRATVQPLFAGLNAISQNRWPSLSFDIGHLNDILHPLFPAGFYNKTFKWPSWHAFEPVIRRIAGLGQAPRNADQSRYEWRNAHCDVLVVGAGAAGMFAASAAADSGARVILLESDHALGGELLWRGPDVTEECTRFAQEVHATRLRTLLRTTAVGFYDHGLVTALQVVGNDAPTPPTTCRERWWRIRAKHIILATGAFEQPLTFPFNDRPGIVLADSVRHYLHRYAIAVGRRVVVATNNDTAYRAALDLRAAGIAVPCLIDTRPNSPPELVTAARAAAIDVHIGARILRTHGERRISAVEWTSATAGASPARIECDALGMSGGWNPVVQLYCQAGGKLRFDAHHACFTPDGNLETVHAVGAAAAHFDSDSAEAHLSTTLTRILKSLGLPPRAEFMRLPKWPKRSATGEIGYVHREHRDRTWLDFQHDVTVADVDLATLENFTSVEHMKRYTTAGMSVDQGKTSNVPALAVLAQRTNQTIDAVGTTTFRPMFTPVPLGAIAGGRNGRFYLPERRLPGHAAHEKLGAQFRDYGNWQRPACYSGCHETELQAIHREVRAVRGGVGLFDGSPLGKFLVRGPDAAEFLHRLYVNDIASLKPGKVRYGLMLNEQGIVIDDGVCARLSQNEFWVNTTSGGAARIATWFEEWLQGEWHSMQVIATDLSSNLATIAVAGPRARDVLAALPGDIDVSPEMFPHMSMKTGRLCDLPCWILRVSYTGELSYEISVPADYGNALLERLREAGDSLGITPFGVEALLLMRTEKGYLHVGTDTDGTTVPADIGFDAAIRRKTADFVGRRSLSLRENARPGRRQFIGLRYVDGDLEAFIAGAQLLEAPADALPSASAGYVTSAAFSPTLNSHVGLGLLENGRERVGQTVYLMNGTRHSRAQVVSPAHYDASGTRLHV